MRPISDLPKLPPEISRQVCWVTGKNRFSPGRPTSKGAKELLTEAGYPNGLTLTLDILSKSTYNTIAQVIQANLAQAGIRVQINIHESGAFWVLGSEKDRDRWKDLQLILNRYSSVPDPSYYTRWYLQNQVGIWNWERFRSDEYDELDQNCFRGDQPGKARRHVPADAGYHRGIRLLPVHHQRSHSDRLQEGSDSRPCAPTVFRSCGNLRKPEAIQAVDRYLNAG